MNIGGTDNAMGVSGTMHIVKALSSCPNLEVLDLTRECRGVFVVAIVKVLGGWGVGFAYLLLHVTCLMYAGNGLDEATAIALSKAVVASLPRLASLNVSGVLPVLT